MFVSANPDQVGGSSGGKDPAKEKTLTHKKGPRLIPDPHCVTN